MIDVGEGMLARWRHATAIIAVWAAVLPPGIAAAAPDAPPRVVVDLTGRADETATLAHLRSAFGEHFDANLVGVDEAIDRGFGTWGVAPPATLTTCAAQPLGRDELLRQLADIEQLVLALEYGDALSRLNALETRLCAAIDPLPSDALARIPYLLGIIHFYQTDANACREYFRRAVERRPDMAWDGDFPPDPQELFQGALSDAIQLPRTTLMLLPGDTPPGLRVDGIEIGPDRDELVVIGPRHFLQATGANGDVATVVLDTGGADRVDVIGPIRAKQGLLLTPDTEDGALAYGLLVDASLYRGYAEVIVLQQLQPDLAWRYNSIDRRWQHVSLVLRRELDRAKALQITGGVLIGVGAAVAIGGAAIGFTNFANGRNLQDEMQQDAGLYELLLDEYEGHQQGTSAGFTMLGVGGALMIGGIPLAAHGGVIRRGALQDPRLGMAVSPAGAAVGFTASF